MTEFVIIYLLRTRTETKWLQRSYTHPSTLSTQIDTIGATGDRYMAQLLEPYATRLLCPMCARAVVLPAAAELSATLLTRPRPHDVDVAVVTIKGSMPCRAAECRAALRVFLSEDRAKIAKSKALTVQRVCGACRCVEPKCARKPYMKCSRCSSVYYCNTVCQATDWPRHKSFCFTPEH